MNERTEAQKRMMEQVGVTEEDLSAKEQDTEIERLRKEVTDLREALEALLEGVTE